MAEEGRPERLRQRILRIAPQIAEVELCETLDELSELTRFNEYHAVMVDWSSATADTDYVANVVRACPLIPVIVISSEPESSASEAMLRLGAQDYLIKRETRGRQLVRAILHAIDRKDLDVHLKSTLGELGQANARLKSLAFRDTLTGALNRRAFSSIAAQRLARARRDERPLALLYCDLDGFKEINDSLGHDVGDMVLKELAGRMSRVLRRSDNLARLGGDEFAMLVDELPDQEFAVNTARRLRREIARPLQIDAHRLQLSLSIGIACYPECGDVDTLIHCADQAMYHAKHGSGIALHASRSAPLCFEDDSSA